MSEDEPRRVTILPFNPRPPDQADTPAAKLQKAVDPGDSASLLAAYAEALVRLRDYATVTHLLATQLLEMAAQIGLVITNAADVRNLATIASKEAASAETDRHDLARWRDQLRSQSQAGDADGGPQSVGPSTQGS